MGSNPYTLNLAQFFLEQLEDAQRAKPYDGMAAEAYFQAGVIFCKAARETAVKKLGGDVANKHGLGDEKFKELSIGRDKLIHHDRQFPTLPTPNVKVHGSPARNTEPLPGDEGYSEALLRIRYKSGKEREAATVLADYIAALESVFA